MYSLLAHDVTDLDHQMRRILPWSIGCQIDIQDGVYVPSTTLPLSDVVAWAQESRDMLTELPYLDIHLQVTDYTLCFEALRKMSQLTSIRHVFVHNNCHDTPSGMSICPALKPDEEDHGDRRAGGNEIGSYPAILVMTIYPGMQGQDFIPSQLAKIGALRRGGYTGEILVDGGINPQSVHLILQTPLEERPDTLCVGSYLARAPDQEIGERIETLEDLAM